MASTNKYDRQLRLWGASGQESLALSHALLIGSSSSCGTELLKNLVLPGLGGFTVIDTGVYPKEGEYSNSTMTIPSSNFFAPPPSSSTEGKSKAEVISKTLNELNPEVVGGFHVPSCSISEFITNKVEGASTPQTSLTEFIKQNSNLTYPPSSSPTATGATGTILIIGNDLSSSDFLSLSKISLSLSLPCLLVRTYGLIGSLRLQSSTSEFTILQPRPENVKWDLRLNSTSLNSSTFPELAEYFDKKMQGKEDMDVQQHSHIPYPCILSKAVREWQASKGKMSSSFDEKAEFKELIKKESRNYNDELNYQEAVEKAYTAYAKEVGVPGEVRDLFEREGVKVLTPTSSIFNILLNSLMTYLEKNNDLPPLNGSIPDMTSDTDGYVELQKIYQERSLNDLKGFTEIVEENLKGVGREGGIPDATVATFVKNVPYLTVVPSKSYYDEMTEPLSEEDKEALMEQIWDPYEAFEHSPFLWWIGLKACEGYWMEVGNWPGKNYEKGAEAKKAEVDKLTSMMLALFQKYGVDVADMEAEDEPSVSKPIIAKIAEEMCRFNGAEMHNVGSVLGGVASQEAIKVITGQYVPINNTYIFNGIAGCAGVLRG